MSEPQNCKYILMKDFIDFLNEEDPVDEHVFPNRIGSETRNRTKPIFSKPVHEEVGGMTAPAVPAAPNGAPGPIMTPGSEPVMPTVINGNAPSHCGHCHHRPHHGPHHRLPPPPPPPFRRYLGLVAPFGRVIVAKKKKTKKSKKRRGSKNNSTRKPKNPY